MSADAQVCLTLLRRHRALQLEALGITWAGSRMAALIEKLAEHAAPISLKKGNRRMEGNYKDPYYAKKKFEKTDVYDSLIQIDRESGGAQMVTGRARLILEAVLRASGQAARDKFTSR